MKLTRRQILKAAALGAPLLATGCGGASSYRFNVQNCLPIDKLASSPIRIDMHCHLLNLHDLDEKSFVAERVFNLDEKAPNQFEKILAGLVGALGKALQENTLSIDEERAHLNYELSKLNNDPRDRPAWASPGDFCAYADSNQRGNLLRAENLKVQQTGVFSNRIRNAARLMAIFPQIDIFTPSMVDLFEDEVEFFKKGDVEHEISTQINFYSNLNLATSGRFLPLVSFNPARQFVMREKQKLDTDYLDWVEKAISELGFIGVKVHPSYGFSPYNNLRYACFTANRGIATPSDKDLYYRFSQYDEYMEALYEICKKYDVPILTHNGDSISLNRSCMEGEYSDNPAFQDGNYQHNSGMPTEEYGDRSKGEWTYAFRDRREVRPRDESDWTNSPKSWLKAMKKADDRHPMYKPLRVCLAHFANGFKDPNRRFRKAKVENLERSRWLTDAVGANNPNLYSDLSIMNELFEDKTGRKKRIKKKQRELFSSVLTERSTFVDNIMYGTDWHMPNAAKIGREYYDGMTYIISNARSTEINNIMGQNAVRFFGLDAGQQNRARLQEFYANAPDINGNPRNGTRLLEGARQDYSIDLSRIGWWSKI